MTGFFLRLSNTAVMPWTARSRAASFHEWGVNPQRGLVAVGQWFSENSEGNKGA